MSLMRIPPLSDREWIMRLSVYGPPLIPAIDPSNSLQFPSQSKSKLTCGGTPFLVPGRPSPLPLRARLPIPIPVLEGSEIAMAAATMAQASTVASLGAASSVVRTGDFQSAPRVHFGARLPAVQLRRRALTVRAAVADMEKLDRLVTEVEGLTLEECRVFTDKLQERLGVSAASFAPAAGAPAGAAAEAAPAVEEKTEFDLVLDDVPSSARIAVIKAVRTLTALGLKEAKDMIEGLPKKVKEGVSKEDAEEAMKTLEAAGAKCSIK